MQAKDIPTMPVLEALTALIRDPKSKDPKTRAKWATHWQLPDGSMPRIPIPPGTPDKVARAKMDQLERKGLVDGCACGCRGDWVITDKGLARLAEMKTKSTIGVTP